MIILIKYWNWQWSFAEVNSYGNVSQFLLFPVFALLGNISTISWEWTFLCTTNKKQKDEKQFC